ncbi:uncharacterized protein I303_104510 [Kwoniella dejecticola CBS 10117]|uniref:Dipeptidyl-peptidase V n=1 Tax=Kwoniella dejecticola CBS 10117 TaxID=1296121 RepID=A0A1A6A537_9TREE|nr:peptidase [Kwoniella dejecticola CBS 10117]OBR85180.1 peptidase [Kwoniella dejecticola CBS 10117]
MRVRILAQLGLLAVSRAKILQDVFTPKDMLGAPRPQPAIASPDGSHAISVIDQWEPASDKTHRSAYLLSLNTTHPTSPVSLLNSSAAETSQLFWLDPTTFAYLNGSSLYSYSINLDTSFKPSGPPRAKEILTFPEGVNPTGLTFEPKSGTLAFSGQVWESSDAFDDTEKYDKKWEDRGDSALVYDDLFVRHWDEWRTPGKVWTIGVTSLVTKGGLWESVATGGGHTFVNLLKDTGLYSQMDPIGSFSLTSSYLAAAIKTPHLNYATHTREDIYLVALPGHPASSSPRHLTPHSHGAISAVTFSPDGKKLAWLEMKKDGYESDKRVIVVHEEGKGTKRWTEDWDRSPSSLTWSLDSDSLYFTAEHHGRVLPYHLTHPDHLPTPLYFNGTTTSITPLANHTILISQQSLTSPSDDFILAIAHRKQGTSVGDGDNDGDKLPHDGLKRLTAWSAEYIGNRLEGLNGEEFWFEGAEGKDVMGWALKPRGWEESQKKAWPLAFLIHGGPQGAWEDAWSTRWNPALFASQGYFVVAINPTGSTGYGQDFTDAIQGDWGGKPFKDLLAGYHAALARYPEIDPDRTAGLGASYGGYMVNWINGHNDHFGFKALVCHDGVFDTVTTYFSTEEVWFPTQDFAGTPLTHRANYERWSPVNHAIEWNTPELVIQGGKDYRLENSQGLGAFTALQTQGVPSRFVYFPDENHWVLKPHNSLRWHHEVFKWLHEWVGRAHDDNALEIESDSSQDFVIQA